ncbi:uncharacterized protein LOC132609472 [Lycium barbarum]|uniref:uncharacterized protein LOC132609472 n=1 Tax=Lycium barbarum TaxID=112863 RepID=UPI00293E03DB|nr:uncharacterized protein LOC132609472 [Lycium barbarum]
MVVLVAAIRFYFSLLFFFLISLLLLLFCFSCCSFVSKSNFSGRNGEIFRRRKRRRLFRSFPKMWVKKLFLLRIESQFFCIIFMEYAQDYCNSMILESSHDQIYATDDIAKSQENGTFQQN